MPDAFQRPAELSQPPGVTRSRDEKWSYMDIDVNDYINFSKYFSLWNEVDEDLEGQIPLARSKRGTRVFPE